MTTPPRENNIPAEDTVTSFFASKFTGSSNRFPIPIGDDMAQINIQDADSVLVTTDMLLEGAHFDLAAHTPQQIGYKSMAVSLSDCAAMATVPLCAVVSVGLPNNFGPEKLKQLHKGLVSAGLLFDCHLVGGDITAWHNHQGKLAVSVTILSTPGHTAPVTRSKARPGDTICVTGSLGASIIAKHLDFVPRVKEALEITRLASIHAMIDISDGLSTDLARICRKSNVGALIEANQIPISAEAKKQTDPLASALNDGEDFELLFTISPAACEQFMNAWDQKKLPITRIGTITNPGAHIESMTMKQASPASPGKVQIVMPDDSITDLKPGGYDHL
jgi:thiamine-monophosphate kinase